MKNGILLYSANITGEIPICDVVTTNQFSELNAKQVISENQFSDAEKSWKLNIALVLTSQSQMDPGVMWKLQLNNTNHMSPYMTVMATLN